MIEPIIISQTVQNEETAAQIKSQILLNMPEEQKLLMENMSLLEILKTIPEEQAKQMLNQATEQINQMQESIKEQAAVANVKSIYKNTGVDTDKIQMNYIFFQA